MSAYVAKKPSFHQFRAKYSGTTKAETTNVANKGANKSSNCQTTTDTSHFRAVNLGADLYDLVTKLNAAHQEAAEDDKEMEALEMQEQLIENLLPVARADFLDARSSAESVSTALKPKELKAVLKVKTQAVKDLVKKLDTTKRKRSSKKRGHRVTIYIDDREGRNNDLLAVFQKLKYDIVVVAHLKAVDFIICLNNKLFAIVERKKLDDLCSSIDDQRLTKQTVNMIHLFPDLEGQTHRCILLLEKMRRQSEHPCHHEENDDLNVQLNQLLSEINQKIANLQLRPEFAEDDHVVAEEFKKNMDNVVEQLNAFVDYAAFSSGAAKLCPDDKLWLLPEESCFDGLTKDRSRIMGSVVNRMVLNGFSSIISESDTYTAFWLLKMMMCIQKNGDEIMKEIGHRRDFRLESIEEAEKNLSGVALKDWLDSRPIPSLKLADVPVDSDTGVQFTAGQRDFALQFRVLKSITMEYIWLIVQRWPCPDAFAEYLTTTEAQEVLDELAALKPEKCNRAFGYARALQVYNFWFSSEYAVKKGSNKVIIPDQ